MLTNRFYSRKKQKQRVLWIGSFILLSLSLFSVYCGLAFWALRTAENELKDGYPALAVETLRPYKTLLVHFDKGCKLVLQSHISNEDPHPLRWAGEACLSNHHVPASAWSSIALSQHFLGKTEAALDTVHFAVEQYPQFPILHQTTALLLTKLGKIELAVDEYSKAVELDPSDLTHAMLGLRAASSIQKWQKARKFADLLKLQPTQNATAQLLIARALKNGGDESGARDLLAQVNELLKQNPQLKIEMKSQFSDLLD